MDRKDLSQRSSSEIYLIIWLLVVGGIVGLWTFRCLTDSCYLTYDSAITEIGTCLDTEYDPVIEVPQRTETLYICGIVDGKTPMSGSLYLFYEDSWLYTKSFYHKQGIFYHPITRSRYLEPGTYQVEIWYVQGSRTVIRTEFEIISP